MSGLAAEVGHGMSQVPDPRSLVAGPRLGAQMRTPEHLLTEQKKTVLDLELRWQELGEPRKPTRSEIARRCDCNPKTITRWLANADLVATWRAGVRVQASESNKADSYPLAEQLLADAMGAETGADLLEQYLDQIERLGDPRKGADRIGLSYEVLDAWEDAARRGDPSASEWRLATRRARLKREEYLVKIAQGTPGGVLKLLEAHDPEVYSRAQRLDISQKTTIEASESELTDDELDQALREELEDVIEPGEDDLQAAADVLLGRIKAAREAEES